MNEVILIGNGKLADAIESGFNCYSEIPIKKYMPGLSADKKTVFVHVGSGRQYNESLQQAIAHDSTYIQAATEKDIKFVPPAVKNIRFINAPNLDINIIKLFYWLKLGENLFKDESISIIESHQKEKKSQPGTALKICNYLNLPPDSITSIRDPEKQKQLNISNLEHHAYHQIRIGDENSRITIETKIEGADSYAKGLARIVDCVDKLENGAYEIDDLLKLNLL